METKKITKKEQLEFIRRRLGLRVSLAQKVLLNLYRHGQTPMERSLRGQILEEKNGQGFTAFDSPLLTSLAEQLITRKRLSNSQNMILLRRMPRYTRQVFEALNKQDLCNLILRERASNGTKEGNQ